MSEWNEARIDVIASNGNDGLHYDDVAFLKSEIKRLEKELSFEKIYSKIQKESADIWREAYFEIIDGLTKNINQRNN